MLSHRRKQAGILLNNNENFNYFHSTDNQNNTVTTQKLTTFLWVLWRDQRKQNETIRWGTKTKNKKIMHQCKKKST